MLGVTSFHWWVYFTDFKNFALEKFTKIFFRVGKPSVTIWIPNLKQWQIRLEQLWVYSLEYHGFYSLDIFFGIVARKRTPMKWVWSLRNFQWQFRTKKTLQHFNLSQQQLMKIQLAQSDWPVTTTNQSPWVPSNRLYSKKCLQFILHILYFKKN